ncbi:MAG: hypothetical protein A2X56_09795 [Nitrospirae bacterium GWC2_57_13]|jgi:hypothetical protein|nr:MAG: hypothetical protein A2072_04470 [Nitrospirae bacterium GWC1_57_7]OGW27572.1 MAG: hypothetical protein A2X56_09795 [Nitrospirae bacterium GWC2_57_13]OGW44375.1 MAG: hypothetical protein A2X57_10765 [Nitrospirae bacterium GWD2_57_8]HAR45285.1 hypothetical protein [Nitrospiraceae bacterium]HAS55493.1 hypothetical protein [Nitrospiraceae bacterium]
MFSDHLPGKKSLQHPSEISNIRSVTQVRDLFKKNFFVGLLIVLSAWASCSVPEAFMSAFKGICTDLPASFIGRPDPGSGIVFLALLTMVLATVRRAHHPAAGGAV